MPYRPGSRGSGGLVERGRRGSAGSEGRAGIAGLRESDFIWRHLEPMLTGAVLASRT